MSVKLTGVLQDTADNDQVVSKFQYYEDLYRKKEDNASFIKSYYDLVTDFYEYGWGQSFHFAPRAPNESFAASLARHEHYLAHTLGLRPGMLAADFGCGLGGPQREIARFSGASIVGVNNNGYQLERARKLTEEEGLGHLAEYLECDFMQVNAPDSSFDAIYSIEATCCTPDKVGVYGEAFRLLKPGGSFAAYEYCLTGLFDETNPRHLEIKRDIEVGGGLQDIVRPHQVDGALSEVGFEILETRDLSVQTSPGISWYQPLIGSGLSFASLRKSTFGRFMTHNSLRVLEALRVVPKGTVRISKVLNLCAVAMAEAGRLGIFTPMYFIHTRKPG